MKQAGSSIGKGETAGAVQRRGRWPGSLSHVPEPRPCASPVGVEVQNASPKSHERARRMKKGTDWNSGIFCRVEEREYPLCSLAQTLMFKESRLYLKLLDELVSATTLPIMLSWWRVEGELVPLK